MRKPGRTTHHRARRPGAGILIADPGERAATRLLADLDAGATYALVCNFRDAPEAPPHTALGMTASFTVE